MSTLVFIFIVFVSVLFALGVILFNTLVRLRNLVQEAWSGIDVQLKRRHNLLPNLVEVVKGYSAHEKETLKEVSALRSQSRRSEMSDDVKEIESIEKEISGDIRQIFALVEDYPDLKASDSFLELQETLVEIEDQLQFARRYYNGAVRNYRIKLESFPSNLIAGIAKFEKADFFEIEYATERSAPDVDL